MRGKQRKCGERSDKQKRNKSGEPEIKSKRGTACILLVVSYHRGNLYLSKTNRCLSLVSTVIGTYCSSVWLYLVYCSSPEISIVKVIKTL